MKELPIMLRKYLAEIGRRGGTVGGKSRSKAKARAARLNGRKGGRPRKDQRNGK